MKRLGVAAIIRDGNDGKQILLGRRGKDPNRGLYVLPGGGVEKNEGLEEALRREIKEETGLDIEPDENRWRNPYLIELSDRVILVVDASAFCPVEGYTYAPTSLGDLYDVAWFSVHGLPPDISPAVSPILIETGLLPRSRAANNKT